MGQPTRGTTSPKRLRRVDAYLAYRCERVLRGTTDPLVVDLGFGSSPATTIQLRRHLAALRPDLHVIGLDLDPDRVRGAQAATGPGLEFARGGFELAGLRPCLIRAFNVLRQYPVGEVRPAWSRLASGLAPGGLLVEGTCDELGRVAGWYLLDRSGPVSLTLAARVSSLGTPLQLAERLPKALIHRNVAGEPIHEVLAALDDGWRRAAGYSWYGARQRWVAAVRQLRAAGWPVLDGPRRWRLGEVTIAAAPAGLA